MTKKELIPTNICTQKETLVLGWVGTPKSQEIPTETRPKSPKFYPKPLPNAQNSDNFSQTRPKNPKSPKNPKKSEFLGIFSVKVFRLLECFGQSFDDFWVGISWDFQGFLGIFWHFWDFWEFWVKFPDFWVKFGKDYQNFGIFGLWFW